MRFAARTTAIAAAANGGVFFAFSTFVMPALDALGPIAGADAMRAINVTVLTPWFMTLLFGTALACFGLAAWSLFGRARDSRVITGALIYLVGCIGVTIGGNVPLNEALMAGMAWIDFYDPWQVWNHVRCAACFVSAMLLVTAKVSEH